jgi:hypothetical protein
VFFLQFDKIQTAPSESVLFEVSHEWELLITKQNWCLKNAASFQPNRFYFCRC